MVWAETRWIPSGDGWGEVRSTASGLIADVGIQDVDVPDLATRYRAAISIVTDGATGVIRKLPQLYLGPIPLFAARDVAAVKDSLHHLLRIVASAEREPMYLLVACEIDDRRGIYAGGPLNRSSYRLSLSRLGMKFATHPYLRLTSDGGFNSEEWGRFTPSFVLLGDDRGRADTYYSEGAQLVFRIAARRLGPLNGAELKNLAKALQDIKAVGASDPASALAAARR